VSIQVLDGAGRKVAGRDIEEMSPRVTNDRRVGSWGDTRPGTHHVAFVAEGGRRALDVFRSVGVNSIPAGKPIEAMTVNPDQGIEFDIKYRLKRASEVKLRCQLLRDDQPIIRVLPQGGRPPGKDHDAHWDGRDATNNGVPNGCSYGLILQAVPLDEVTAVQEQVEFVRVP
jgi:hypothetical protein